MRTIAIDDPGVCQSVSRLCYAASLEVLFEMNTVGTPRNIALDVSPDTPRRK